MSATSISSTDIIGGKSIYIDSKNYYIFVQPSQNKKSDRLFFESLLKKL